eukprot:TRINITY_DN1167_c0_g1_i2.p1 TRINITY_DN1167_c0_g1~~TRINITY_DN1167_c0_g1_i2.p1  ORF type:complete len:436 (-),score=124.00 TRINITY_DN1167_c0_g1_i2:74-1381(-)
MIPTSPDPPYAPVSLCGFEGPEKKLELHFTPSSSPHLASRITKDGLRVLSTPPQNPEDKYYWQKHVLDPVHCTIMHHEANEHMDAFVLSESSLFVYPRKIMIKTCGRTTLLRCLDHMIEAGRLCGLEVDVVLYSRKNFVFPDHQPEEYLSFSEGEVQLLNKRFPGHGYVYGKPGRDHWHLYVADMRTDNVHKQGTTLEVMMHDLPVEVMQQFFQKEGVSAELVTETSGIARLMPAGTIIDPFQFEPCGYSMNAMFGDAYYTIHITPEDHCSYVSFETNARPTVGEAAPYSQLIAQVAKVFRPGRMTAVVLGHDPVERCPCRQGVTLGGSECDDDVCRSPCSKMVKTESVQHVKEEESVASLLDGYHVHKKFVSEFEGGQWVIVHTLASDEKVPTVSSLKSCGSWLLDQTQDDPIVVDGQSDGEASGDEGKNAMAF